MNRATLNRLAALALLASVVLSGCGGGAETQENPVTTPPSSPTYNGPAPQTADVQAFRINLWDNVKASNRCGQCHTAGGQAPMFARTDDVNLAYEAANTVVNLTQPAESRMVIKVGGGHNCWLASNSACADVLTTWITNWAGASAGGGTQIQLQPPPVRDVASSRNWPDTPPPGFAGVHNLTTQFCSRCHTSGAAIPQSPFFASPDPAEAYAAARTKINLDDAALSRLVVRLRSEFHNCWTNCTDDANLMQARIQTMIGQIALTPIDPSLTLSKALTLYDGTVASGGSRFDGSAIAKFEFKTGSGGTAYDTSGVEPALNLTISGDVQWVGGWGINVRMGGKAQGSTASSKKLHDLIKATGEYTFEAWVAPANVDQEDAYLASYSGGAAARNFTVAQQNYQLEVLNRSSVTNADGQPSLITEADDEDIQATLQHIVVTFDPVRGRRIFVNGEFTGDVDASTQAAIGDWDDTFAFVLGNEVSGNRQFQGVYRLVVVHNRVLTDAQIAQNFDAGVGERYYLLFGVSHIVNVPSAYILFEVSQFDSYGYLFNKPAFISLDASATPGLDPDPRHPHRRERRGAALRTGIPHGRHHDHRFAVHARRGLPALADRHGGAAREGPGERSLLPVLRPARHGPAGVQRGCAGGGAAGREWRSAAGDRHQELRGPQCLDGCGHGRAGHDCRGAGHLQHGEAGAADRGSDRRLLVFATGGDHSAGGRVLQRAVE